MKKTAVILIHGIGEQVPMETLRGFVDTVWTSDASLVSGDKPDPDKGRARNSNASWSKPDERNRSFELQVITTETGANGKRIDFFEYYWAHRVSGTTWEQVRDWFLELLLRNPVNRVPKALRATWVILWLLALLATGAWTTALLSGPLGWTKSWTVVLASAVGAMILSHILRLMLSHVGDIVRYVKAEPRNIAVRQAIRENGVQLLETLMGINADGTRTESEFDRIIMVGHSLGTIIGYDILTNAFGRMNTRVAAKLPANIRQPERAALEQMVREAAEGETDNWSVDEYRRRQSACLRELWELGNPWILTDFVTLGSPLTHAEFLMERDREALELAQKQRILPTCPPTLEYDGTTKQQHFTYRARALRGIGDGHDLEAPRIPHHAALFAFTRWTNIFSPQRFILGGDIVSGPLSTSMGLSRPGNKPLSGILDIPVLPSNIGTAEDRRWRLFTHLKYWNRKVARIQNTQTEPAHICEVRGALALAEE